MISNKILFFLLVTYVYNALAESRSCILLRKCPEALNVADKNNSESIAKLKRAFCGVESVDGQRLPKVYCSDFINVGTRLGEQETNIETHKNIALLPEKCGDPDSDRIVGGEFASLYEFPWMTLISYVKKDFEGKNKYEFKCGGTVINSRYILTAAHCVNGTDKNVAGVRVGEHNINTKVDCQGEYPHRICESNLQDIKVSNIIVHEDYANGRNDIALLRLKKPVDFSFKNAKPLCLPIYESLRNINLDLKRAVVAGWGVTEVGVESPILRKVNIPIKTQNECQEYYDSPYRKSSTPDHTQYKLCAGEEGKDSCRGDSGGPLMLEEVYNSTYRMVQFGIVSYGPTLCGSTSPGVYTDVRKYMKWILDHMEE